MPLLLHSRPSHAPASTDDVPRAAPDTPTSRRRWRLSLVKPLAGTPSGGSFTQLPDDSDAAPAPPSKDAPALDGPRTRLSEGHGRPAVTILEPEPRPGKIKLPRFLRRASTPAPVPSVLVEHPTPELGSTELGDGDADLNDSTLVDGKAITTHDLSYATEPGSAPLPDTAAGGVAVVPAVLQSASTAHDERVAPSASVGEGNDLVYLAPLAKDTAGECAPLETSAAPPLALATQDESALGSSMHATHDAPPFLPGAMPGLGLSQSDTAVATHAATPAPAPEESDPAAPWGPREPTAASLSKTDASPDASLGYRLVAPAGVAGLPDEREPADDPAAPPTSTEPSGTRPSADDVQRAHDTFVQRIKATAFLKKVVLGEEMYLYSVRFAPTELRAAITPEAMRQWWANSERVSTSLRTAGTLAWPHEVLAHIEQLVIAVTQDEPLNAAPAPSDATDVDMEHSLVRLLDALANLYTKMLSWLDEDALAALAADLTDTAVMPSQELLGILERTDAKLKKFVKCVAKDLSFVARCLCQYEMHEWDKVLCDRDLNWDDLSLQLQLRSERLARDRPAREPGVQGSPGTASVAMLDPGLVAADEPAADRVPFFRRRARRTDVRRHSMSMDFIGRLKSPFGRRSTSLKPASSAARYPLLGRPSTDDVRRVSVAV